MVSITPAHSCKFVTHWCTAVNIKIIILLPTPVDKWKQYIFSNPLESLFFCSRRTPHEKNIPNTGRPMSTIPTNAQSFNFPYDEIILRHFPFTNTRKSIACRCNITTSIAQEMTIDLQAIHVVCILLMINREGTLRF